MSASIIARLLSSSVMRTIMTIDEAREYLAKYHKPEYQNYIMTQLAGDFAAQVAEDHERLVFQLGAELKWRSDNDAT